MYASIVTNEGRIKLLNLSAIISVDFIEIEKGNEHHLVSVPYSQLPILKLYTAQEILIYESDIALQLYDFIREVLLHTGALKHKFEADGQKIDFELIEERTIFDEL